MGDLFGRDLWTQADEAYFSEKVSFVATYGWKGILVNKLENLKMVLFDFDDTLAIHSHGHRISDHLMKYMINVHSESKELWNTSKPNIQLKKFMDYLAYKNIPMGLISGVHDCKSAERKIEWVKENYGYSLGNYCVSSQEQKMIELSTIAEVNGLHRSQIAFVDDYYENLGNAEKMGFTTFSPMEIVNLVNCIQNTDFEKMLISPDPLREDKFTKNESNHACFEYAEKNVHHDDLK